MGWFDYIDAAGGDVKDANGEALTVTGYSQPTDVNTPSGGPFVHAQTLTMSGIDLASGLAGGTDSFSLDITYSSLGT